MQSLNKRSMMLAISVSLATYAFAISGCGKKSTDDTDATVAVNALTMKNLQGRWVEQGGYKDRALTLKVDNNMMSLHQYCLFDDRTAAVELKHNFAVKLDALNFASTQKKTNDNCTAEIPVGDMKYNLKGDQLTLAFTPDSQATPAAPQDTAAKDTPKDTAKDAAKNSSKDTADKKKTETLAGLVFVRVNEDDIKKFEADVALRKKDPKVAPVDPKKPADPVNDASGKSPTPEKSNPLLGRWIADFDDSKLAAITTELNKHNFQVLDFKDQTSMAESIACSYKLTADGSSIDRIPSVASKLILFGPSQATPGDVWMKIDLNTSASTITIKTGAAVSSNPIKDEMISPKAFKDNKDKSAAACELNYANDLVVKYSIEGNTLKLDDKINGTRTYHKMNDNDPKDLAAIKMIKDNVAKPDPAPVAQPSQAGENQGPAPADPVVPAPVAVAPANTAPANPPADQQSGTQAPAADPATAAPATAAVPAANPAAPAPVAPAAKSNDPAAPAPAQVVAPEAPKNKPAAQQVGMPQAAAPAPASAQVSSPKAEPTGVLSTIGSFFKKSLNYTGDVGSTD